MAVANVYDQLPPLIRLAHPLSIILERRQSHSRSSRWSWRHFAPAPQPPVFFLLPSAAALLLPSPVAPSATVVVHISLLLLRPCALAATAVVFLAPLSLIYHFLAYAPAPHLSPPLRFLRPCATASVLLLLSLAAAALLPPTTRPFAITVAFLELLLSSAGAALLPPPALPSVTAVVRIPLLPFRPIAAAAIVVAFLAPLCLSYHRRSVAYAPAAKFSPPLRSLRP